MREGGLHYPLSHYLMTSYPNFITDDYNTECTKNIVGRGPTLSVQGGATPNYQKYKKDQVFLQYTVKFTATLLLFVSLVNNFATEYNTW